MSAYLKLTCGKCSTELVRDKVTFMYMKNRFDYEVYRCPVCAQVFIPEEDAAGKLRELEAKFERK